MELANALEAPLLTAPPKIPDLGNVQYYTLLADLREYVRFDTGEIQLRNPDTRDWVGQYSGTTASRQWLRNENRSFQSRRTPFLCIFPLARIKFLSFSSRNNLDAGSNIRIRIFERDLTAAGDMTTGDVVTATINSTDADVIALQDGRYFAVDLRSRNIVLNPLKRYAMDIDNNGNGTFYRDVLVKTTIEERVVQP